MLEEQKEWLKNIGDLRSETQNAIYNYWSHFSYLDTWQFWLVITLLVVPLIILYFYIDRRKIFHIAFFGYSIHILIAYLDAFGVRHNLWDYPYLAFPFLPANVPFDGSLVPVFFMLVYQYCLNNNKNFYLYFLFSSFFMGFIFVGTLQVLDLIILNKWVNHFYISLFDFSICIIALWMTRLFLWMSKNVRKSL